MPAPKGNEYYKLRLKSGKDKEFKTPDALWSACCKYFQWVDENPLEEEKVFHHMGDITTTTVAKKRAMTLARLYVWLKISETTFLNYRKRDGYVWVTETVDKIIYSQKFEGAAAGLLNANIIARDLGLAEKKEHSGPDGGPIETKQTELTQEELEKQMKERGVPIPID